VSTLPTPSTTPLAASTQNDQLGPI